jgi:adenylate cyclase class 2
MPYEVEVKFPLEDPEPICGDLEKLGIKWLGIREEVDLYFQHPSRDFSQTDEALRIRHSGGRAFLTYKGPKLDPTTKTRDEIELPLDPDPTSLANWRRLLERLGFRPVAEVSKRRRRGILEWGHYQVEVSMDEVEELGWFLELEVVVEPDEFPLARDQVLALTQELGLGPSERRSYLELLLLKKASSFPPAEETR